MTQMVQICELLPDDAPLPKGAKVAPPDVEA
jgi:hypothetical protein